jgi:hypothetical protein
VSAAVLPAGEWLLFRASAQAPDVRAVTIEAGKTVEFDFADSLVVEPR